MSEGKRYGAPTGEPKKNLPGQGETTRIGGSNTQVRTGETRRIFGGGGGSGNGGSGDGIFKDFGREIGKNPLGAVANLFNNGINDPMTDLTKGQTRFERSQGQLYQAKTQTARNQANYYAADAKRDVYGDNRDSLYNMEAGKLGMQAQRYGVQVNQPNYSYSNQNNGFGGQQGNFPPAQNYGNGQLPPYGQQYGGWQQPNGNQTQWVPPVFNEPVAPVLNSPLPPVSTNVAAVSPTTVAPTISAAATAAPVAATATPVTETKELKPAASIDDAKGGKTRTYSYKAKAPKADEIPAIAENQVKPLQDLLIAAGVNVGATGADGKYGPNTHFAIKEFASKLNPPISDLTSIDFTDKNDPERNRFLEALGQGAPSKGPSADDLAAAKAAEAAKAASDKAAADAAKAAQQRAQEDARVPESVRHTVFDPRNIGALDPQQRYDLARHTLHGLDELSSEKSRPNLERMHDKMDETVRWVNKHMGTDIPRPSPADPLSNEAMYALGLRAAYEGKLSNARGELVQVEQGMTQSQMNHRAVEYIKALDRGVSREDPSRAIRKFEKEDMGRTGIEVDGLADPQMLEALRQAVAARNGLYSVASAPQVASPVAETNVKLPDSVTGGMPANGASVTAPVVPNAMPIVDGATLTK